MSSTESIRSGLRTVVRHAPIVASACAYVAWFGAGALTLTITALGLAFAEATWRWQERTRKHAPQSKATHDTETLGEDLRRAGNAAAIDQLARLKAKHGTIRAVLDRRLRRGELTSRRYAEAADQAYAAGLDNLREIAIAHTASQGIDAAYLKRQLAEPEILEPEAREALLRRRELLEGQQTRTAALLSQNETIMTALDEVGTRLADTRMGAQQETNAQEAIETLARLARRTAQYAEHPPPSTGRDAS